MNKAAQGQGLHTSWSPISPARVNLNHIAWLEPLVAPGEFCVILRSGARLNMTCTLSELQQRIGAA